MEFSRLSCYILIVTLTRNVLLNNVDNTSPVLSNARQNYEIMNTVTDSILVPILWRGGNTADFIFSPNQLVCMGAKFPQDWGRYPKFGTGNWSRYGKMVTQIQNTLNLFMVNCADFPPLMTLSLPEEGLLPHEQALGNLETFFDIMENTGNDS